MELARGIEPPTCGLQIENTPQSTTTPDTLSQAKTDIYEFMTWP